MEILRTLLVMFPSPIAANTCDGTPALHADPVDRANSSDIFLINLSLLKSFFSTRMLIIPGSLLDVGFVSLIPSMPSNLLIAYSSIEWIYAVFFLKSRSAVSAALPNPTMLWTAKVPARNPCSCSPPCIKSVMGCIPYASALMTAAPTPFGP